MSSEPVYDLQAAVEESVRAGRNRLELPPGQLKLESDADYALDIEGLKGFTIEGRRSTLVLDRPDQGLARFRDCDSVTLLGFSVRHRVPSMTQGRIRSVSADKGTYEVEIMPGYIAELDRLPTSLVGYIFDPDTLDWRTGSVDLYFEKATAIGTRRLRLEMGHPIDHAVSVGDLMAFRGKGRTAILFANCARTKVDGLKIYSSSGFAIHEAGGEGGSYYRYSVLRGPVPEGADTAPLLSSNADAFHSSGVRRGPQVQGCRFEYMADDGIPIHGNYLGVVAVRGRTLVLEAPWPDEWFRPGDRLRIYAPQLAQEITSEGLPRVVSWDRVEGAPASTSTYVPLKGKSFVYTVTLDRELEGIVPAGLVTNAECQGDGFVVRNNTILNNRARGMLITASDGVIEDNTVDGSTIAGIVLSPELYWLQSDFSRNVVVRRNTIRNVSRAAVGPWSDQVGGLVITGGVGSSRLHRGITVENNSFASIFGPAIVVRRASKVTLKGNRFKDLRSVVNDAGKSHGIPAFGERFVDDSEILE